MINTDIDSQMKAKCSHILLMPVIAIIIAMTVSCGPQWKDEMLPYTPGGTDTGAPDREVETYTRKVLLLYSAGFNSISSYLKEDIGDLEDGWVPKLRKADDVLLVYSHQPKKRGQYSEMTEPVLFRMYSDNDGKIIKDTLIRYEAGTISADAAQLNSVLTYVKDHFKAKSYGLIYSSHATGYLPSGFYSNPNGYFFDEEPLRQMSLQSAAAPVPVPYIDPTEGLGGPAVKSVGQDVHGQTAYETDIREFAEAIPMKLDYILFDACLMGGIEVAYELAGKCDKVGFSQAEVLAEGFNYKTLTSHLLANREESSPYDVCRDYFLQYDKLSGDDRSATISLVDCNRLDDLAKVCKELFEKYSDKISRLNHNSVQRFYRGGHHWFFDLQSILENVLIDEDESERLEAALANCIIYKGATPSFMPNYSGFNIDTFSGFSMYLPSYGHPELDRYYKTLKWNQATGLVK